IPPRCSRVPDVAHVHHSALVTRDVDASLRFYRDGLGLRVLMDHEFDGDWRTLFGAPRNRLRSVFLGDPDSPDAGIVELVTFGPGADDGDASRPGPPRAGFFLLSFFVDVDTTMARLAAVGLDDAVRRITVSGPGGDVDMVTVRDPNGVLVELVGTPQIST
ncbi:MAG TPA: VOC family protein, partial [Acidimicrobiia bacterium]|nr:VOC family protein [Acidimicrobiia bacterium]